ncbi:MAG TPA: hypothetical protein VK620_27630 [Bradyrhizobium sp.]|nr:hypothetical protein [Bradyrhizobium sp.]
MAPPIGLIRARISAAMAPQCATLNFSAIFAHASIVSRSMRVLGILFNLSPPSVQRVRCDPNGFVTAPDDEIALDPSGRFPQVYLMPKEFHAANEVADLPPVDQTYRNVDLSRHAYPCGR